MNKTSIFETDLLYLNYKLLTSYSSRYSELNMKGFYFSLQILRTLSIKINFYLMRNFAFD